MATTETPNEARQYAAGIAHELRTWEAAADGDPAAHDDVTEDIGETDDRNVTISDYLDGIALAVTVWRTDPDADGADVRVEILRTYGGPSCRIEWDSRYPAAFEIVTHWGGSAWHMTVHAPTLGDQLAEVYQ